MQRVNLQNLLLAALVGLLAGLSPHTSGHRLTPSIVGGVAAGALVFGVRERSRRRSGAAATAGARVSLGEIPLVLWACLLAFCAVFAPTFSFLYQQWTESIWENGHGLFVPFLAIWLGVRALRRDESSEPESSAWGLAWLAAGLGLAVLDAGVATGWVSAAGLVVCLPGLSLLLLGARRTRALLLPLALCVFMIPIPADLAIPLYLPDATAAVTEPLVELTGVPVLRLDSVLTLPYDVFAISDRCAGASAFFAAVPAALFLAYYTRSPWRRAALLLAPWPLVVVLSGVRCAFLLVYAHHRGLAVLDLATHGLSGVVAFWSVMLCLWLMAERGTLERAFA